MPGIEHGLPQEPGLPGLEHNLPGLEDIEPKEPDPEGDPASDPLKDWEKHIDGR